MGFVKTVPILRMFDEAKAKLLTDIRQPRLTSHPWRFRCSNQRCAFGAPMTSHPLPWSVACLWVNGKAVVTEFPENRSRA